MCLLSIVMPSFNSRFIQEAVASVLAQTFQNWQLFIADCSTDSQVLAYLGHIVDLKDARIKVFIRAEHHLPGDNRNFCIEKADSEFILCLDADDTIRPTFIEEALFLANSTSYDLIGTSIISDSSGDLEKLNLITYPTIDYVVNGGSFVVSTMFRRSLWQKLGGFVDTGLGHSHVPEDWDFFVRAMLAGCKPYNRPGHGFTYRRHKGSLTRQNDLPSFSEMRKRIKARHALPLFIHKARRLLMPHHQQNISIESLGYQRMLSVADSGQDSALFFLPDSDSTTFLQTLSALLAKEPQYSIAISMRAEGHHDDALLSLLKAHSVETFFLPDFLPTEQLWSSFIDYLIINKAVSYIYLGQNRFMVGILDCLKAKHENCQFEYLSAYQTTKLNLIE